MSNADGQIAAIYKQLANQLSDGTGVTGMNFNNAKKAVGQSYDTGGALMQAAAKATMGDLHGRFDKLGIGRASTPATQGLRNELAGALTSAARRRSSALSGLANQQVGYEMAGRMGVDNSKREGAQQRADAAVKIQEAIANMERAKAEAQGSVDAARIQGETELTKLKLSIAQQEREYQRSLEEAEAGNPLEALRAEKLGVEIETGKRKLALMGAESESDDISGKGQYALNSWLDQNSTVKVPYINRAKQFIDDGFIASSNVGDATSFGKDPYVLAMGALARNAKIKAQPKRRIAEMIQVYFGKGQ